MTTYMKRRQEGTLHPANEQLQARRRKRSRFGLFSDRDRVFFGRTLELTLDARVAAIHQCHQIRTAWLGQPLRLNFVEKLVHLDTGS